MSTRKGGRYYGYKGYAALCATTGLPLAWTHFAFDLIDATRLDGFAVKTAIMDKGYHRPDPRGLHADDP